MKDIDPEKDFERLVVVEQHKTRVIGLKRDTLTDAGLILDYAVGLTIKPLPNGGMAPALASMDYCMYSIMGLEIHGDYWLYWPHEQEENTKRAFKDAYFTMLKLMDDDRRQVARAKSSGIVAPKPGEMQKLQQLAQSGRLPR